MRHLIQLPASLGHTHVDSDGLGEGFLAFRTTSSSFTKRSCYHGEQKKKKERSEERNKGRENKGQRDVKMLPAYHARGIEPGTVAKDLVADEQHGEVALAGELAQPAHLLQKRQRSVVPHVCQVRKVEEEIQPIIPQPTQIPPPPHTHIVLSLSHLFFLSLSLSLVVFVLPSGRDSGRRSCQHP
jgi:hypothetical protein